MDEGRSREEGFKVTIHPSPQNLFLIGYFPPRVVLGPSADAHQLTLPWAGNSDLV